MAKTRTQKQEMLERYQNKLSEATGVIVLTQNGLTPGEINELKQSLQEVGSSFNVVKNTIFQLALEKSNLPGQDTFNAGPNSVVYTNDDVASTAKILAEFVKTHKDNIQFKAGILDGQELTLEQVKELSELPSKEQSIAMIAGLLEQNISGIANVMQDSVRSIEIILDKAFNENK